jgi:iron complex outermembrane receptor protein
VQTGEIQVKGYEVEARASLSDSFDLVAAYTNLEDTVTKTNTQNQLGKTPVGIPEETASLWANYTFHNGPLAGFGLGAGVRYVGSTWGTASNLWGGTFPTTPSVVPSYTLADAMVRYEFGAQIPYLKGLELSINARNLFDKEYISYCGNINFCQWGQRRVVLGTFTYRW